MDFIIAGQTLDTTGTCGQADITMIVDGCTEDFTNPTPQFGVVGALDGDDRVSVRIGRDLLRAAEVADQSDLQGPNKRIRPTFQPGRNLLRVWGDEDEASGGEETHFFRINVLPYWELNGVRLSKDDDCQSTTARTAAQITDSDCILTTLNPAVFRLYNVINEYFNLYVDVNGDRISQRARRHRPGRAVHVGPRRRRERPGGQAGRQGQPAPRRNLRQQLLLLQGCSAQRLQSNLAYIGLFRESLDAPQMACCSFLSEVEGLRFVLHLTGLLTHRN